MGNLLVNINSFDWRNSAIDLSLVTKDFILGFENSKDEDKIFGHPNSFNHHQGWGYFHEIFSWGYEDTKKKFKWIDTEIYNYLVYVFMNFTAVTNTSASDFSMLSSEFLNQNNGLIGCRIINELEYHISSFDRLWKWRVLYFTNFNDKIDWGNSTNDFFPNIKHSNLYLAKLNNYDANLTNLDTEMKAIIENAKDYCDGKYKIGRDRGSLMGHAETIGVEVATRNYYVLEEVLSNDEFQIRKNSKRKILSITKNQKKIYLSIDFEKCNCFEICNHSGKHLGEFRFDGINSSKADESGKHDIWKLTGQRR